MKRPLTILAAAAVLALASTTAYAQAGAAVTPTAPVAPAPPPPPAPPAAPTPAPAPPAAPAPLAAPATTTPVAPTPAAPAPVVAPTAPIVIDPKALALIDAMQAKLKSIKSLSTGVTTVMTYNMPGQTKTVPPMHQISDVKLLRPNYAKIVVWDQAQTPPDTHWHRSKQSIIQASDGKNYWFWMGYNNQYMKSAADPTGNNIGVGMLDGLNGFFSDGQSVSSELTTLNTQHKLLSVQLKDNQTWNGTSYTVLEFSFLVQLPEQLDKAVPGGKLTVTQDLYVGDDMLVHRAQETSAIFSQEADYDTFKVDTITDKTAFAFTPPAGSKPRTEEAQAPPPLKNGTVAPDFTVQDPDGKPVKLSSYRGKVVVIDFWATWCGPCQASLPHTNEVAEKFKGKDVVFLAVNTWDKLDAFKSWLPDHKSFDALNFVIDPTSGPTNIAQSLYKVSGIPTQFVISKTGKVTNSFVGYGGPTDDLENAVKAAGG